MVILDPVFLEEVKDNLAQLTVELIAHATRYKLDYWRIPALEAVGESIRLLERLRG
jgi:hypothetical protein